MAIPCDHIVAVIVRVIIVPLVVVMSGIQMMVIGPGMIVLRRRPQRDAGNRH